MSCLRVLSYNVRSLRDDRAAVTRVIRRLRPDLVVVQEAPRGLRWRPRCAAFARDCELLYIAGGRSAGGNLLLAATRVATTAMLERRIPQPPREPIRGIVGARVDVGGDPDRIRVGVLGIHLGLRSRSREAEVARVLAAADEFGDLPVVIAGDLNEPAGGPSWQALERAGFVDPANDSGRPTFPARSPQRRIDGILVRGDLRVGEHRVPALLPDLSAATDHLPVVADLAAPDGNSS